MNIFLEDAINLINEAQMEQDRCPKNLISGPALIAVKEAIEKLKEFETLLRVPTKQRHRVVFTKWHKKKPDQLFVRWDTAFSYAVLEMSLLYCDFTVNLTKSYSDGEAKEYTITSTHDDKAIIKIIS